MSFRQALEARKARKARLEARLKAAEVSQKVDEGGLPCKRVCTGHRPPFKDRVPPKGFRLDDKLLETIKRVAGEIHDEREKKRPKFPKFWDVKAKPVDKGKSQGLQRIATYWRTIEILERKFYKLSEIQLDVLKICLHAWLALIVGLENYKGNANFFRKHVSTVFGHLFSG